MRLQKGFVIVLFFIFSATLVHSQSDKNKILQFGPGIGLGALHADMGIGLEVRAVEFISGYAALGLAPDRDNLEYNPLNPWNYYGGRDDLAYQLGVFIYPYNLNILNVVEFLPRVGASYGYNGLSLAITYTMNVPVYHENLLKGLNVSAGLGMLLLDRLKLEMDLMIPVTRSGELTFRGSNLNLIDNKSVYLNFGIRYYFNL